MAIDLTKKVYKKIEDGQHSIKVTAWQLKVAKNSEEYIELTALLDNTDREIKISLFERSLAVTLGNVSEHLQLEELAIAEVLDIMKDKALPAYHDTVVEDTNTYYNWWICSEPKARATTPTSPVAPADDAPDF